jgi:hypothetical protein
MIQDDLILCIQHLHHRAQDKGLHTSDFCKSCLKGIQDLLSTQAGKLHKDHQNIQECTDKLLLYFFQNRWHLNRMEMGCKD